MAETGNIEVAPTTELVDDVMKQSQETLEKGARLTRDLRELQRRAKETADWRLQVQRHPWTVIGLAAGLGALVFVAFRRR